MRRIMMMALAGAAIAAATPASAAVTVVGPAATATSCTSFTFTGATEVSCAGGYTGNLLSGSPETGTGLTAIQALGYTGTGAFPNSDKFDFNGSNTDSLDFGTTLSGLTIIGIHYGGAGDSGGEATSFFSFDAGTGIDSISVTDRTLGGANALGLSNAVLFSTGGAVPEPATWAMMLLGFGGIGLAMRRSRRRSGALMQIA